jgi:hypothetical protein
MMKKKWLAINLMVFGLASVAMAADKAQKRLEFSAEVSETFSDRPEENYQGKMYVNQDWLRDEGSQNGQKELTIYHFSDKKLWTAKPDKKEYVTLEGVVVPHPLDERMTNPCVKEENAKCISLGEEKRNGRKTEKWRVVRGSGDKSETGTTWIDEDLHIVVRDERPNNVFELRNIQVTHQPEALFSLPSDYKEVVHTNVDADAAQQQVTFKK